MTAKLNMAQATSPQSTESSRVGSGVTFRFRSDSASVLPMACAVCAPCLLRLCWLQCGPGRRLES